MSFGFSYREGSFSPAEAASITGVAMHLQRDWRSQGLLRARESGRAAFAPRELAYMRLMMKLRALGVALADAKPLAEEAAPAVIYAAISHHYEKAIAVDGPAESASKFRDLVSRDTNDGYLHMLAGSNRSSAHHFAVIVGDRCILVPTLGEGEMLEHDEVGGLINLWGVANALISEAHRPLFTLVAPQTA